jgi:hypothetical protein
MPIYSPCLDLGAAGNPYLEFWYHRFGGEMGTTAFDIWSAGTETWTNNVLVLSNLADLWQSRRKDLPSWAGDTIILRIRGNSLGELSEMALDDILIADDAIGIAGAPQASSLMVYPNPASDHLYVRIETGSNAGVNACPDCRLELRDALGRVLQARSEVSSGSASFDVSGLSAGLYFVVLEDGSGRVSRARFSVQR